MYSHLSLHSAPFSFILVLLAISFFINLQISFCADDPNYLACSQPFQCGSIGNISYPFWTSGRAENCGHPAFELKCGNNSAEIQVQSQTYNVLRIDESERKLRLAALATNVSWNGNCPSTFRNISFPSNALFYLDPLNQNITLFYGCPFNPVQQATTNTFSCSVNDTDENYYWVDTVDQPTPSELISGCNISVKVNAVDSSNVNQRLKGSQLNMEEVLKEGFDVGYNGNVSFCSVCEISGGACGYNRTSTQPLCFCNVGAPDDVGRCSTISKSPVTVDSSVVIIVTIVLVAVGIMIGTIIVLYCKRKHSTICFIWKNNKKAHRMVEEFLKNNGSLAPKRYNYSDVKKITNSFKDKVGQGGFGFVYKGKLPDGHLVAVKLLNKAKGDGEDFINEVGSIMRTSHVNIVTLLGFCTEGSKRALIYEFMPNGSLEKFIYDPNALEAQSQLRWEMLYKITVGVARGLEYLHRGCNTRILHFDIKPHNILLDHDFTPKISDFGLAKLCPNKESIISMLDARGTAGYIAPEVFNRSFGGISHKSDVYSYGMMVLEIVGRRKNINAQVDNTSEIYFPQWIYKRLISNADLELYGVTSQDETEIAKKMILVALWCIQTNPVDRPSMTRVVEMLEGRNEVLQIPPKPYLCSPPRSPVGSSIDI